LFFFVRQAAFANKVELVAILNLQLVHLFTVKTRHQNWFINKFSDMDQLDKKLNAYTGVNEKDLSFSAIRLL
jgi:hypothetical protein